MTRFLAFWLVLASMAVAADKDSRLVLSLVLPESAVCKGAKKLPVRLVFQNAGPTPVEIDLIGFGEGFYAMALYNTESNSPRFDSLSINRDGAASDSSRTVKLQPGMSHVLEGTEILDPDFFGEPGFYQVSISYSGRVVRQHTNRSRDSIYAGSNWAIFQVKTCSDERNGRP